MQAIRILKRTQHCRTISIEISQRKRLLEYKKSLTEIKAAQIKDDSSTERMIKLYSMKNDKSWRAETNLSVAVTNCDCVVIQAFFQRQNFQCFQLGKRRDLEQQKCG